MKYLEAIIVFLVGFFVGMIISSTANAYTFPQKATESRRGGVYLATQAETNTGTNDAKAVTPLKVSIATQAQAENGVDTQHRMTPERVDQYYFAHKSANFDTADADTITAYWHSPAQLSSAMQEFISTTADSNQWTVGTGWNNFVCAASYETRLGHVFWNGNITGGGCTAFNTRIDIGGVYADTVDHIGKANDGISIIVNESQCLQIQCTGGAGTAQIFFKHNIIKRFR